VLPRLAIGNPWDGAALSRDPAIGAAVAADPLCESRTSLRLASRLFEAMDRVRERLAERGGFPLPVLLIHGTADTLVPTGTSAYAGAYPSVERRLYPDVRHEPHHDPVEGARVVDEMTAWLRERLGA
jgi:alpha-beta hydrolase superfamily lysophospholipase